jgi:hypothetical protein
VLEIGPNLFHASGAHPKDITADLVAVIVVRDEMWRLPFLLAYHRWLGVRHFIVIDNRSKDGTLDYLKAETDITCVHAPGQYGGSYGKDWVEWAVGLAPPARWNLVLDGDELFVGHAFEENSLNTLTRAANEEGAAIVTTSVVDCYPAEFPSSASTFEPVPWRRLPYFDRGPYFDWPSSATRPANIYHGVRERLCWPNWQWRKLVPRFARPASMREPPPLVINMPLLRNIPGIKYGAHVCTGGRRSRYLCGLLHYKLDIDLPAKVESALRERNHWAGSREYEAYARLLSRGTSDLKSGKTVRFEGPQSLVEAKVAHFEELLVTSLPLAQVEQRIWQYGDLSLQRRVWEGAQRAVTA